MADIFDQMMNDVDKYVDKKADEARRIMKQVIHKQTGALSESVDKQQIGKANYLVGINTTKLKNDPRNIGGIDYTPYYYHGSKPHVIRAKNGGTLRWIGKDGRAHFAKEVHHPGSKPHDFLGETIARMK